MACLFGSSADKEKTESLQAEILSLKRELIQLKQNNVETASNSSDTGYDEPLPQTSEREELKNIKQELEDSLTRINDLEEELIDRKNTIDEYKAENDMLKASQLALKQKNSAKDGEIAKLKADYDTLKTSQTKTTSKDHDDEKQHPKLTSTPSSSSSSSRKSRSKRFNLSRLEDQIEVLSSEGAKARSLLLCTKPEIVSQNTDDGKTKTRNFGFIMFLETSMGDKVVDQLYSKFKANAVDGKQLASLLTLTVIIYKVKLHKLKTGSKDKPPMDSSSIKGSVEHLSAWIIRSYGDKVGPKKQVSVTDDTGRMIKGEYKTITATIDKKQFQKGITSWVHKYVEMEGSLNES